LIKEQLIGQTVRRAMAPRYSPSPGDFWKAYSQLNVREELAVVPIAVASFEKLVGEPDQSALKELFEKYRDKVPTMTEPGFRQPGRIQLAYLEVDFEKVGQTVPEVTDAEVKAYYEANKENYRNFANRAFPSESEMPEAGSSAAGTTPFDGPALVAPAMTSTPAEATTSQPSPEKTTPAAVTPPAGTSTPAPAGTSVAPPAGTSAASPAGTSETSAISQRPFGESLANILDEAPPATTSDVPPPAGTSVELPAPATTSETPKAPEPEYRPLDETLKERIRTQLKTERVLKKMEEISAAARGELFKINSRYAGVADGEKESVVQEMDAATQAYAKEHGLRYSKTPFYSFDELSKSEDHPIGSSTEPSANRFERTEARTVSEQHFGVEDVEALERQRYLVFEAEDPRTLNRFLHWQIGFQDSHTPTWEEEGVPEQVREAWINQEAQKLAEKRASEVAEMLRKSEATWSETLAEVNETGQEGSQSLIVTYSNQFSWLTPSSAPRSNPLAPPVLEISDVPIILGGADNEFMETVFEKLGPGEIGTVWSSNRHYVNVVRVDNRTNVEEVRNQFLQSSNSLFSPFAPFQNMMMNDGRRVVIQWNTKLYDEFDVEWVRDNEK
ncbi:MAG: hypothetical protein KDA78_17750, partial [Planctomycetaceae bacterium]|nr:hypothetical protein [Planctomycetaceae bacterium]